MPILWLTRTRLTRGKGLWLVSFGVQRSCGFMLESTVGVVPTLAWPMRTDQFANGNFLEQLKMGTGVCEGEETIPSSDNLTHWWLDQ